MRPKVKTSKLRTSTQWWYLTSGVLVLIVSGFVDSVSVPVPDTKGTHFLFSTPFCSADFPAKMHVIPQSTEAVNATLEMLDAQAQPTVSSFQIKAKDSLHLELACTQFVWELPTTANFQLQTTSEVSVYIDIRHDSYMLIPTDAFGHNFIVSSITTLMLPDSIIVIHGNYSHVELTLPADIQSRVSINGKQYEGGSTINISLPSNGVVGIKCSCDFTGAIINSALPISVLVGSTGSSSTDAVLAQLPAKNTWGRKFIFTHSPWFAQNITLKVTGEQLNTVLTIATKDSTEQTRFQFVPVISMQLALSDFLSIQANTSVLCVIMYEIIDEKNSRHMAMSFLTPIELYHISSSFTFDTFDSFSSSLVLTSNSFQYISFNTTPSYPFDKAMTYLWNYFICNDISLSRPHIIETNANNIVPFYGTVLRRDNNSAYEYSLGMRITSLYGACVHMQRPNGGNGDGIDNDCDNQIDEEKLNKVDDDKDGLVDEDVAYAGNIAQKSSQTAWEYHLTHKEKGEKFSSSVLSIVIPLSVALASVLLFIGGMLLAEKIRRSGISTRITPIYLQQHEPILQRY